MKFPYFLSALMLISTSALATDANTAVGGGLGGAAGAAIGQAVGGKTGAVIGGAVGGGVGAAATTKGDKTGAVAGGAAGGAVGAAVGQSMGGKTGAVIGAGVGGAAGSVVGKNVTEDAPKRRKASANKVVLVESDGHRHYSKKHRGHAYGHDKQDNWKHGKSHDHED